MTIGIALGLLSGYFGGAIDALIMRIADVQLTFPAILVALLIDGIVRSVISVQRHDEIAVFVIVGAIGLSFWVQYARTVRGSVMVEKNKEYVQAARVIGLSPLLIMVRHVLPNIASVLIVQATIQFAVAILAEAGLSYLGLGAQPPVPSWGRMLRDAQTYIFQAPELAVWPGLAIALAVLGLNMLGDGLRDLLDPRLRLLRVG